MTAKRSPEQVAEILEVQENAMVSLVSHRRRLLELRLAVPATSRSRQCADRALLLATRQLDSGGFDHARGEELLHCAREAAAALVREPPPAATGDFATGQYASALLHDFDIRLSLYLSDLLAVMSASLQDTEDRYARLWHTALFTAHKTLQHLVFDTVHGPLSTDVPARPASRGSLVFCDPNPTPQAQQLALLKDRYEVLGPDHDSPFRCVLAPLRLILISPEGYRQDIDLAGPLHEPDELPCLDRCPLVLDPSHNPTVVYTDRRGRSYYLLYNPAGLRYERVAAHSAAARRP